MPEFSNGCYFQKKYTHGPTRPSQRLLSDFLNFGAEQQRLGVPSLSLIDRLDYIEDFWKSLSLLHKKKVIVGDISPYNLILQETKGKTTRRRLVFVDVDSFQVESKQHWRMPESTLNWRAPEDDGSHAIFPSAGSDIYKGVLLTIRLLHHAFENSSTSYSLKNPSTSTNFFEGNQGLALSRLISKGLRENPNDRPSSREISMELSNFKSNYLAKRSNG
jgi:serine/threonine protein kinase